MLENIQALGPLEEDLKLQHSMGWQWRIGHQKYEGWELQTYQWKEVLAKPWVDFCELNRRWRTNLIATKWVRIWKKVWGSFTFYRDRVLIWRVLNLGFFHNRRAKIWGMSTGLSLHCHTHIETLEHMIFECRTIRRRWASIAVQLVGS